MASFHEEDKENLGWGFPPSILPYRLQDGFNRDRRPRAFQAAVLENEHLRAVFLPELGGHLWSLVSKAFRVVTRSFTFSVRNSLSLTHPDAMTASREPASMILFFIVFRIKD